MAVLLLPLCFAIITLNLVLYLGTAISKRRLFLNAVLGFCLPVVLFTEILSYFDAINFANVLFCWGLVSALGIVNLLRNRQLLRGQCAHCCSEIKSAFYSTSPLIKWAMFGGIILLAIIFFQGVAYPPNNWDSMTYHIARLSSWISHGSIDNYQTHIVRQLYQPPFAEFVILHVNLLAGGDYFSNTVQFCFMLFTLVAISGIAKTLGLSTKLQLLTILLAITLPELVLQASSTQNDVVVTFFVTTAAYFAVKAINAPNLKTYLIFGLAIGLAMLTKATAYVYLAPVLAITACCVLYRIFKQKAYQPIAYGITAAMLVVAINLPNWHRNYTLTGTILGVDKEEGRMYANEHMSGILLLSNLVKNAGLHIGIKGDTHVSNFTDTIIHKLHRAVNVDIDDRALNIMGARYSTQASAAHEDSARNPFHFVFIIAAFIVVIYHTFKKKGHALAAVLILAIVLQALLFCGYLKWQPWHSRLHVTMFVFALPVICYAASISAYYRKTLYVLLPVVVVYGIMVTTANELRPIKAAKIMEDRYQKYFAARPAACPEYKAIVNTIARYHYHNIGLYLGQDDWQYPLFVNGYTTPLNPVHVGVTNYSKKAPAFRGRIDCIVTTQTNVKMLVYNGEKYYNQNPDSKVIRVYTKK